MGLASLILGIISIILAFVPFIWMLSIVTAIVGLILGIISLVKKLEKGQSIAGIVLCAITLLLAIMSLYNIYNTFSDIGTTTSTNIETGKQETTSNEDLKKNVTVEALGITKSGDFAFKIINNNDQAVFVDTVNTVFKDANGNFMEKAQSQAQYFGIPANSEVVNYNGGYDKNFSNYPNYEFEIELSDSSWITDNMVLDNFEITANNTGKQIAVQVKNNNDVSFESINILIAYYQNGSIVGCENGYANTSTTAANGTAYINVLYPMDSKYNDVPFDDYKVYLLEANKNY